MSLEKGSLSIHSENIFPIIKKWLYSDHDIFMRELISNSCDAITKLKRLSTLGEATVTDTDFKITVTLDSENKTLKFTDNGIGMTSDEVKTYINQIAFSGAEDFLNKYKDKVDSEQIIGHFGLGFYSAFMVADNIEIHTKSYKEDTTPALWRCDGGTEFELEDGTKETTGTEITLFIGDEGTDFLKENMVRSTIEKYCSFMPYPILLEVVGKVPEKDEDGNVIIEEPSALNDVTPLYMQSASSCSDEDYKEFYKKTFNDFKEPLFWIHLNMDYPFNLKGILYFPKLNNEFDNMDGQIKLYNNQVFVADNIKEVIPEFLLLLKGVIDCPELPLNVSRSFLQNDGFVKKISDYISKKVADKLTGMFKTERDVYEGFFEDISPFIKYGSLKDEKFYAKVEPAFVFKTTDDLYLTIPEYTEKYKSLIENEVYYVTDRIQQAQYIKLLKDHGIESVLLDHNIDQPFISLVESKNTEVKFKRVDSDIHDLLTELDESEENNEGLIEGVKTLFNKALGKELANVEIKTLKSEDVSAMITLSEENRRMQDMMKMYSMNGLDSSMFPSSESLVLNKKHPVIKYILDDANADSELSETIAKHVYDLAMLSHKPLASEDMLAFIKRSNEILSKITK